MRPEFIVWERKLWLRSGWICYSYSLVIKLSFVYLNNSFISTSESSMFCFCVSIRWVSSWVLYIRLICSYWSSKRTEFTFGKCRAMLSWGVYMLNLSAFLLKYFGCDPFLWLFWRVCSLDEFLFTNNDTLKGNLSNLPSCYINNYLTTLLLITHPIQSYLRYGIGEVLGLWNDLGWYCWLLFLCWYYWLVFLWVCWRWFGTFWCWNVFPKSRLTMG